MRDHLLTNRRLRIWGLLLTLTSFGLSGCEDGGGLPDGWRDTPAGTGPQVVWDLNGDPLPELPLPNDVATWPDPTSATGLRINVSEIAPTSFERHTREQFDNVDGWGTYSPISIPFDAHIDTRDLVDRQGGIGSAAFDEAQWPRHAVYLVNLETGLPIPLDVNGGNFPYVLDSPSQYWRHDPRAGESNILFETVEEDTNGNGELDPGEDTDFDGVLDHPNTFDGRVEDPMDTVDEMTWFYERETKTLLLKPLLPMEPKSRYAVVVTDRLLGENGQPIRSPFDHVHHISQYNALADLPSRLAEHPELYGDVATRGWDGISFAWTFTTQSTTDDLDVIREGLYGRGTMDYLAETFGPDYALAPMQGGTRAQCGEINGTQLFIAPGDQFLDALTRAAGPALGLNPEQSELVANSYRNLSHVVVAYFDSPYFLGDPDTTGLEDTFQVDYQTGEARVGRDTLSMILFVPKEGPLQADGTRRGAPFPTAFYVHGYGSASAEPLPFMGFMTQHGVAGAMINAEGHGVSFDQSFLPLLRILFAGSCLEPTADAFVDGRAQDQDGDGVWDSGVDFWTAYVFHTRDVVRQTAIDHMRAIQVLRSFDGRTANPVLIEDGPGETSLTYDGNVHDYEGGDIAGDFDGDGVPDIGGPDNEYFFTGGSLGGIISGIIGGTEPAITAAAPIVGAGGLIDVGVRTDNGGVLRAMHQRLMGPWVMSDRRADRNENNSSCEDDQLSLYFGVVDRNDRAEIEFACIDENLLDEDDVLLVHNFTNGETRCAGATNQEAAHYRVGFPADAGDLLAVEIYEDALLDTNFETCRFGTPRSPALSIQNWQVSSDDCEHCAELRQTRWQAEQPLVSPAMGFGRPRQSANLRRLMFLSQTAIEPADPINYARRVLLDPIGTEDAAARPTNLAVINSIGDQNVPLSAGNAYARAAGVLPFMGPGAPDAFADWRAPAWFEERYPGLASPNDVLLHYHILEGVDRLNRHPTSFAPDFFLYDVDDVAEGRMRFQPDGRHQTLEDDGVAHPRLDPPLRWVRRSHAVASANEDVWRPQPGEDISGLLNNYAIPRGVHGFDELVYDPALPWDPAQYVINLIGRWGTSGGRDLHYHSNPEGHTCLSDSSCDFLQFDNPAED